MFFAYILHCCDGSYYTGHTDKPLQTRVAEHQAGLGGEYTARRLPVRLVFSQDFPTRAEALRAERQIKGWSRKKKEALMAGDWERIRELSHSGTHAALRQAQGERE